MLEQDSYPQLYIDFIYYFNIEKDYYECHEVLEELWLETGRERFYQGLLQVAVGLYHFQNDNKKGAIKMMIAALQKLSQYPNPICMGINLNQVKEHAKQSLQELTDKANPHFTPITIQIVDPKLQELIEKREKS